jgi:hypothetical protein
MRKSVNGNPSENRKEATKLDDKLHLRGKVEKK